MWLFIVFYILGLHTSQASGQDNSTQMYYAKLTIDESAIENITALLKPFMKDSDVYVDNLSKTTICQNNSGNRICECESGFIWTKKICEPLKCCNNISCTFSKNTAYTCVSNKSVIIRGNLTLQGVEYFPCLDTKDKGYQNCTTKLFTEMKTIYSTLRGFDTLNISSYRLGSVIVDFEMAFAQNINIVYLQNLTVNLSKSLIGKLKMETAGIVTLQMPNMPVCQDKQHSITCTITEPLKVQPKWELEREGQKFQITNGTESDVTIELLQTKVKLNNISELWEGEYTCLYVQTTEYYTLTHQAKSILKAQIKAKIDITVAPSFPYCAKGIDSLIVQITCQTQNRNESLIVTWKSQDIKIVQTLYTPPGTYTASVVVDCKSLPSNQIPNIICSFNDTCNQVSTATTGINIIRENETLCKDDGDWKNTKAGFTAQLQCKDSTGQRQRYCNSFGTWEPEVSRCVNNEVTNVLQKATIVDIGLGIKDDNVAQVFSLLGKVTNDSKSINTFANMNATIAILDTLSKKDVGNQNSTATNDFLESSSNLLDRSLQVSWETKPKGDEKPLADTYLSSVEKLIKVANITNALKKKNIEVMERSCTQGSNCTNKVFNVTVKLEGSDPVQVKTAGFLELDKYLPNNYTEFSPNSIVVSTTTDNKKKSKVRITFELLKQRPRNVAIQCVYWDGNITGWSAEGCTWQGPSSETECVCEHLSSFAILMSKYPLNITGLTEITYAGLSVSVISLVINLLIELTVWSAVVKTNTLYLRHTAHVNISLCLLIADCCFLASAEPKNISEIMCGAFVVLKHFCYLSMFFWMLCLSSTLLHQAIFLFHNVSKKNYLRFSIVLGYVCPLVIVAVSLLVYMAGAENKYYSYDTCWLVYDGFMKGSIYTFVIPVGIIVFINVFSMVVVIMKLLDHPKNIDQSHDKEKKAAITVVRSVVLLTPVFGLTWIFGFAVMLIDLTSGNIAYVVNYIFTLLNAFQGLFILLTTCLGDKLTREALLNRLTSKTNTHASTNDSTTKLQSTINK